jgi:hypothetical protein
MKRSIIAMSLLVSVGAFAQTSVSLQTGQIFKQSTKVTTLSLEQKVQGLNLGSDLQVSSNGRFKALDVTAGADLMKLGNVGVSAKAGVGYVNPGTSPNGYVGILGVQAELPLSKQLSLVASSTRDFGLQGNKALSYSTNQVGIKYLF